jgi:protein-S-isoprenylcysteine O-methyltransferase Ste14
MTAMRCVSIDAVRIVRGKPIILGYARGASKPFAAARLPAPKKPMRSLLLVGLQVALMLTIAVPFDVLAWNLGATLLVAAGAALGLWTLTANRIGNFNVRPEPKPTGILVTAGPYRHVRHPMYLAVLVAMLGFCVGYGTSWRWVALAALTAVLLVKSRIEERALARLHPGYAEYARRTRRIVPFLW